VPTSAGRATEPFLSRGALFALTLTPPLITMVTVSLGSSPPTLLHAAGCLVATWGCTIVVGGLLHFSVNWSAPRLLARFRQRWIAYAGIMAVAACAVVLSLLALMPWLADLGHAVDENLQSFVLRGSVGLAAVYLIAARAAAIVAARAKVQADRALASEEDALRNRLAALQAQMNPHFLFNTLNAVASLVHAQPDLAEATIERLAGVLQYAITSGKSSSVRLGDELDAVRDYLGIEQARFGARLRTSIDVSPELYEHPLPPMLLQPLVENAVLHGLSSRAQGGEIRITGRTEGDAIVLTVSDDGVGPGGSTRKGNRIGLSSVRERIALTFGDAGTFLTRARVGGGFECELRVPRAA
jgi:signal transduction histidine kinase